MNDMTRQEVEADIAAAEARSAALFARLDERMQATVLRFEAKLAEAVGLMERVARTAEASAQRAEESAKRAEESAKRAEDAAIRASYVTYAHFLSTIAIGVGLYFGITRAFEHDMEIFTAAVRAEQRADMREFMAEMREALGEIKGAREELDRQRLQQQMAPPRPQRQSR
ncbi:hypothetical protein E4L96_10800 [Massilia arenosa]|uniref:Uncharacterized protein n=1 Tax=Zemynaea arenosa TaxID=2561931 RepID=A0A4Y9SCE9_9BURK|nr:hypothetical protein [Massilia arenosa]TFW20054.1 hypothetical protein E4L96_10800 [Massilia arenosa]